ncbi:ead/Ea22-like family protein [Salmonella enterica subsp. diarizonae]|nr:ead/Ea22-like family protein [Salmonella enterica subsp. diarizonae]ECI5278106.1 ead/Ea22-like family protein [Salmonella enterica subsp. diarizonae]
MSNIDKQALREAAQAINKKSWQMNADEEVVHVDSEGYENFIACSITTDVARFIAAASPASVLAVLDELDTTAHTAAVDHEAACSLVEENEELKRKLEAENQRNTVLTAKIEPMDRRIAELEARTVNLSKLSVGEVMHMSGFSRDYAEGWCAGNDNAIHEIRTAGIKVKG